MNFKIQGIEGVQNEIKKLNNDRMKRQEILKILRRQMKPTLAGIKAKTPIAKEPIVFRNKVYAPNNLKNSMAIKTGKSKINPTVLVGPRQGRKAKTYDGFYAWWHIYGWSPFHKRGTVPPKMIKPNDFIWEGAAPHLSVAETSMSNELKNYIGKKAKTLNL